MRNLARVPETKELVRISFVVICSVRSTYEDKVDFFLVHSYSERLNASHSL